MNRLLALPILLASLVAPPPWHYCGWLLNVEFECERAALSTLPAAIANVPVF